MSENRKKKNHRAAALLCMALTVFMAVAQIGVPAPQKVEAAMQQDIPNLKDAITAALGEDTIVGMVTNPADNKKEWELLTKHANAVTTGNELKPDCHFGYSNGTCPGKETVTFRGKSMVVPKIDWSRSERFLNKVLEYNEANPDNFIRVRGHVLLWHAQTPEWFFHEDYDPSKPYVTKEEMDARQEWYIKTILEHYLGEDSKYKDLFYGWDVVNEACADSNTQVYRDDLAGNDKLTDSTHGSKSSWWHIYESNEFIINAFKYANKYAPANVELYYNDYNDSWPVKVNNICELLKAVKEQEGAPGVGTRIDAFGMQAHYSLGDFSIQNFEDAARRYLDIVGKIQLTELDMKASSQYDGTDATKDLEYQNQAICYRNIFETLIKLDQIDGYEVGGITFWGVTDPTSWLQSRNDVGGGSDGLRSQCPLLFDGNYEAKPAYWAFVDPSQIKVVQQKVDCRRSYNGKYKDGVSYSIESGDLSATIIPIWNEKGVKLQIEVKDASRDMDDDYITVYYTEDTEGKKGISPVIIRKTRKESGSVGGGYKAEIDLPLEELYFGKKFLFDVTVTDASGVVCALNDVLGTQENSSENYALCVLKPGLPRISQTASLTVDGEKEEVWNTAETMWLNLKNGDAQNAAKAKLLWDEKNLYIYAEIEDSELSTSAEDPESRDSLEICVADDNGGRAAYGNGDRRYLIDCENQVTAFGSKTSEKDVTSVVKKTDYGYCVEAQIAWSKKGLKVHDIVALELRVKDVDQSGNLLGSIGWSDETGTADVSPAQFGFVKLFTETDPKEETENPDATFSKAKVFTGAAVASADTQKPEGGEAITTPDTPQETPEVKKRSTGRIVGISITVIICCVVFVGLYRAYHKRMSGKKEKNEK